jgi:hypothetical protein
MLINININVLYISYNVQDFTLEIQVILLEGSNLSKEVKVNIRDRLSHFKIEIIELHLTKEKFNENIGEWQPKYYKWLNYLLFSKAEA